MIDHLFDLKKGVLVLAMSLSLPVLCFAGPQEDMLKKSGLEHRLGAMAALETQWTNDQGKKIILNSLFTDKPVLLIPVYYTCPMLCQMVLKGLAKGLSKLDLMTDGDFDIVVYSINPNDTPADAAAKKAEFLKDYTTSKHARSITFLTGTETDARTLSKSVGFKYEKDPASGEYVHSAVLLFLSPEGKIMRYMGGIDIDPLSVKLALIEAANGKVGSFWDQILLVCYHYNPSKGKYSMAVDQILRVGGLTTILCLAWFIIGSLKNEKIGKVRAA